MTEQEEKDLAQSLYNKSKESFLTQEERDLLYSLLRKYSPVIYTDIEGENKTYDADWIDKELNKLIKE